MAKVRNREGDSQRLRLRSVEAARLDPLGFVRWAFPGGEGVVAGHDGLVRVAAGHGVGKSARTCSSCSSVSPRRWRR